MKNEKVIESMFEDNIYFWPEYVNGQIYYWKKVSGISHDITKEEFENLEQKHRERT